MKKTLVLAMIFAPIWAAHASDATVVLLRGSAKTQTGKALSLKDVVPMGTTVTTSGKSFVKLLFADNTQLNVGPESTVKIEPTKAGDPGMVNLVSGQIRAKVTKDILQGGSGEPKDKMHVKTKTAAMAVRGTDFNVVFNGQNNNTALITFEGAVAMTRLQGNETATAALADRNGLVMVTEGQYSGANPDLPQASLPVRLSPSQFSAMQSNETFAEAASSARRELAGSPVPPGVDPRSFASGADQSVEQRVGTITGGDTAQPDTAPSGGPAERTPPPEGVFNASTGEFAPRAGGFVDVNSGIYVPPPPGSAFDPNTGVYVPPPAVGGIDPATGSYVPPQGLTLDPVKGFVVDAAGPAANANASGAASGTAAPGANSPAGGSSPGTRPPPAALQALVQSLNNALQPESAGAAVTFDAPLSPMMMAPGAMPPPLGALPPPSFRLDEPVSDPSCPTCVDRPLFLPPPQDFGSVNTFVNFNIVVQ